VASLSQGRTAAAQCGLFTYKSVPIIFEPPCILRQPQLNELIHHHTKSGFFIPATKSLLFRTYKELFPWNKRQLVPADHQYQI